MKEIFKDGQFLGIEVRDGSLDYVLPKNTVHNMAQRVERRFGIKDSAQTVLQQNGNKGY